MNIKDVIGEIARAIQHVVAANNGAYIEQCVCKETDQNVAAKYHLNKVEEWLKEKSEELRVETAAPKKKRGRPKKV